MQGDVKAKREGLAETEIDNESFDSVVAAAAARPGSGVRAQWVELPDCAPGPLKKGEIALEANHENASKATCKNHVATVPTNKNNNSGDSGDNKTQGLQEKPAPPIFDPVVTCSTPVKDSEHHCEQHEHMEPAAPTLTNGPRGRWDNGTWSLV